MNYINKKVAQLCVAGFCTLGVLKFLEVVDNVVRGPQYTLYLVNNNDYSDDNGGYQAVLKDRNDKIIANTFTPGAFRDGKALPADLETKVRIVATDNEHFENK